jgi:hypothetical protein
MARWPSGITVVITVLEIKEQLCALVPGWVSFSLVVVLSHPGA